MKYKLELNEKQMEEAFEGMIYYNAQYQRFVKNKESNQIKEKLNDQKDLIYMFDIYNY